MSYAPCLLAACLICILASASTHPLRADEDKVLDRTKSEWIAILEKDPTPRKRKAAVLALGILGPGRKDVLPVLSKALTDDKDEAVRLQIVTIMGQLSPKTELRDTLPVLADVMKSDKSATVRAAAATLIGKLNELAKPALNTLIAALKDPDPATRAAAVETIGRIGSDAAKPAINEMLPLLKDKEPSVRFSTVFAYGRLGTEAVFVVPDLNMVLESDESADVRREVAKTFAFFGSAAAKPAIPALVKALREDKSAEVRRQVALTLGKMGPDVKSVADAVKQVMVKDSDKTVRLFLVRSFSSALGSELRDHVKDLADRLNKEPEGDVRLAIIQELGALGPPAKTALKALQDAENDVVLQVRAAAHQAIKDVLYVPKKEPVKK